MIMGSWIDEKLSFEEKQGLVAGEGKAKDALHTVIFNKIQDVSQLPQNQKLGYFRNTKKHGMVAKPGKTRFEEIAQTKLEDEIGKEEVRRLEKAVKARRVPKGIKQALQAIKVVTSSGRREEETAKARAFREEGDLASSFVATIRREAGKPSNIDAIVRRARDEITDKQFKRVEIAAEEVKKVGRVFEV